MNIVHYNNNKFFLMTTISGSLWPRRLSLSDKKKDESRIRSYVKMNHADENDEHMGFEPTRLSKCLFVCVCVFVYAL